jgi:hypothetical protein
MLVCCIILAHVLHVTRRDILCHTSMQCYQHYSHYGTPRRGSTDVCPGCLGLTPSPGCFCCQQNSGPLVHTLQQLTSHNHSIGTVAVQKSTPVWGVIIAVSHHHHRGGDRQQKQTTLANVLCVRRRPQEQHCSVRVIYSAQVLAASHRPCPFASHWQNKHTCQPTWGLLELRTTTSRAAARMYHCCGTKLPSSCGAGP